MAGVYKSLDRSDIRLTPFRAHKLIRFSGSVELAEQVYLANYNPTSSPPHGSTVTFDQGNPSVTSGSLTTVNGHYQRVVHRSLDHLYYRDFYTNNKASFGGGNITHQQRFLEDQAQVISIPQAKFGESLLQGSVKVYVTYSAAGAPNQSLTLIDDLYGNLIVSKSIRSAYGNTVSGSVTRSLMGEWPSVDAYKHVGRGIVTFSGSMHRGDWAMDSIHRNVRAVTPISGSIKSLVGVVLDFSSSLDSQIEVPTANELSYLQAYNFENGDFAISSLISPNSASAEGAVVFAKHGPSQRLQTDINGNPFVEPTNVKTPYRLMITGSKVRFERQTLHNVVSMESSNLTLGDMTHVVINKTGSLLEMYIDGALSTSTADVENSEGCSNSANIYIGNSHDLTQPFNGYIDSVKLYRGALSAGDVSLLRNTYNAGDLVVGNVFHTHGMITLTSNIARYFKVTAVEARATQTIWETEISCTVAPGDFGMSSNRSLQVYDSNTNQYVYRPFITGSDFRPFVTAVGLYNDRSELLAIGKMTSPIQLPTNTDTTFIVRFDRW